MPSPFQFLSRRAVREALRYAGPRRRSFTLEALEQRQMMTGSGWTLTGAVSDYAPSNAAANYVAAFTPSPSWAEGILSDLAPVNDSFGPNYADIFEQNAGIAGYGDTVAEPISHDWDPQPYFDTVVTPNFDYDAPVTPWGDTFDPNRFQFIGILPGMPFLDSNPTAEHTLYLNFTGSRMQADFALPEAGGLNLRDHRDVFDLDGNPRSFSSEEQDAIYRIWKYVADDYAPFNVNVTTYDGSPNPSSRLDNVLEVAIGGDVDTGEDYTMYGVSYDEIGNYRKFYERSVFVFSSRIAFERLNVVAKAIDPDGAFEGFVKSVADTASHEAGHAYGLEHQSAVINVLGQNVPIEYRPPSDEHGGAAALMGRPFGRFEDVRAIWSQGSTLDNEWQDDLLRLEETFFSTTSGSGFRRDDVADDRFRWLPGSPSQGYHFSGQIGVNNFNPDELDQDWFAFHNPGGPMHLGLQSTAGVFGNLHSNIELWAAHNTPDGMVADYIVQSSAAESWSNGLGSLTLPAGDYMIMVSSTGGYGNVGSYELNVTATGWGGGINVPGPMPWQLSGMSEMASAAAFASLVQTQRPELTIPEVWDLWSTTDLALAEPEEPAADGQDAEPGGDALPETVPALAGDFDNDGRVTGDDFLTWQRELGTASVAAVEIGDVANVERTADDLMVWQEQFGAEQAEELPAEGLGLDELNAWFALAIDGAANGDPAEEPAPPADELAEAPADGSHDESSDPAIDDEPSDLLAEETAPGEDAPPVDAFADESFSLEALDAMFEALA